MRRTYNTHVRRVLARFNSEQQRSLQDSYLLSRCC